MVDETIDEEVSMVESVNVEAVEETGNGVRESRSWLRRGYGREEGGYSDMTETNLLLNYFVCVEITSEKLNIEKENVVMKFIDSRR